jgi:hypothetical protein
MLTALQIKGFKPSVFVKEVVRLFKLLLSSFQVTPSELCESPLNPRDFLASFRTASRIQPVRVDC